MPTFTRATESINGNTNFTVQQALTTTNSYGDVAPDDSSGDGLVFENGIWKYPDQATGGRFTFPNQKKPMQLVALVADFGASVPWQLWVAGIDGTAGGPDNTTDTPYSSANAAEYREGAIQIDSGTDRYLSRTYGQDVNATAAILHTGMRLYVVAGPVSGRGILRATFRPLMHY